MRKRSNSLVPFCRWLASRSRLQGRWGGRGRATLGKLWLAGRSVGWGPGCAGRSYLRVEEAEVNKSSRQVPEGSVPPDSRCLPTITWLTLTHWYFQEGL